MEIHLTPEKEALLRQVAARTGQDTAQVIQEAVDRLLDHDKWFVQEVEKGQAQAAEGDLLEHDGRPGRKAGTRELVLTRLPYLAVYELQGADVRVFCMVPVGGQNN